MDKYKIIEYLTPELRKHLLKETNLSRSTFHRKATAKIGDSQGFEVCEMYMIANILDKPICELITPEAISHFVKDKKG